ncbi:pentapeptide repeat-containing protein [Capnocytophaga sputigena]|uniref:pentapeptide repeat-containing protein n=1 Tax=Capnocytophaga sputigena TaxID=1019 RepID=UPI0028E63F4D|nr:pentapeptide repeat-containing protein [Capnocytophaga sputigena]
MDLEKYINHSKSNGKEIWLHNLPNDETLFDVIDKLRKVHKEETLVFTEEINIIKKTIDKEVNFSNCIFQEDVNFLGCIFSVKDKEKVGATSLKDKVDFKDCVFTKEADFSETIFEEDTNFSRSIFCIVSFQDAVFSKNVRFHETIFHNNVDFFNTSFKGLVDFYLVKFEDNQQFHTTDFLDRAIFSNTTFKGETQFIYNKLDKNSYINFESAKFEKGLDISRANFNCNLNFWNIFIQNKNISEFTKYVDDFGEHKEEATPSVYKQLRETYRIIKDNFYKQNNKIEGGNFYKKEMNIYLKELNNIIKDKKRKEKSDSTKKKVGSNPFIVLGFYLSGIFTFLYLFLYSVNFNDKHCYASFVCFFVLFIVFAYNKWNTKVPVNKLHKVRKFWYCFFLSLYIGIYLLTLYYFPMYFSTIFIFEYSFLFIIVLLSYLFLDNDRILLYFNKYSNNFGTNWALGVIFTIVSSLVTYILILQQIFNELEFQLNLVGIGNFLRGLVNVLNVTEWRTVQFFEETPTNWQYIILFIGRILVAYGIYQTIQAFRKFGKS